MDRGAYPRARVLELELLLFPCAKLHETRADSGEARETTRIRGKQPAGERAQSSLESRAVDIKNFVSRILPTPNVTSRRELASIELELVDTIQAEMEANINLRVFKTIVLMLIGSMIITPNSALPTSLKLDPEPFINSTTVATNLDDSDSEIIISSGAASPQPAPPALTPTTDEQQQQQQVPEIPEKPSSQDLQTASPALPPSTSQESSFDSSPLSFFEKFDQRQNGTENYRIKVDGLVFILAPADSLLLAGAASLDPNFSSALTGDKIKPSQAQESPKPKPGKESIHKSASRHHESVQKPALRINNLMSPFWNRIRQSQQTSE